MSVHYTQTGADMAQLYEFLALHQSLLQREVTKGKKVAGTCLLGLLAALFVMFGNWWATAFCLCCLAIFFLWQTYEYKKGYLREYKLAQKTFADAKGNLAKLTRHMELAFYEDHVYATEIFPKGDGQNSGQQGQTADPACMKNNGQTGPTQWDTEKGTNSGQQRQNPDLTRPPQGGTSGKVNETQQGQIAGEIANADLACPPQGGTSGKVNETQQRQTAGETGQTVGNRMFYYKEIEYVQEYKGLVFFFLHHAGTPHLTNFTEFVLPLSRLPQGKRAQVETLIQLIKTQYRKPQLLDLENIETAG